MIIIDYNKMAKINSMNKLLSIVIVIILVSFGSCRNSERDLDSSTVSSHDFWVATNHFTNIFREVHKVAIVDSIIANRGNSAIYPEICLDSFNRSPNDGTFPVELNIFYNKVKTCTDQRNKSGQLTATFSRTYPDSGSVITIKTTNYEVEGFQITADISLVITSSTPWLVEYDVTLENQRIVNTNSPGNKTILENGSFKFSSVEGFTTITSLDDDFKYTGLGNGMASNGVIYTFKNETDVFFYASCNYETSGSFKVKSANQQGRVCNFSVDDACNSQMLVSIPPANGDQLVEIP